MSSSIMELADAITMELNSHAFSIPFTARRIVAPVFELKDLDTLRVTVCPNSFTASRFDRSAVCYKLAIDTAIQQRVNPENDIQLRSLIELVESVSDFLFDRNFENFPNVRFKQIANVPLFDDAHLYQKRTFTSVLSLEYDWVKYHE